MKAMILAAGRGKRMRPLTDHTPKPLLKVHGKPLIQYHIEALKKANIESIVVNVAWLGEQIIEFLGDGSKFGIPISISHEKEGALETAGGIIKALPLLGKKPFIVVNADIYTDYDFRQLPDTIEDDMHLVLVDNPDHNPKGDFYLANNRVVESGSQRLTFSGIGVYQTSVFAAIEKQNEILPLKNIFATALKADNISAEYYAGYWTDIGTPERLEKVNRNV